jgi:hypothetical protein
MAGAPDRQPCDQADCGSEPDGNRDLDPIGRRQLCEHQARIPRFFIQRLEPIA